MNKYKIKVLSLAYSRIDKIYYYIANNFYSKELAIKVINDLEESILSLEYLPNRGSERESGIYRGKGYREIYVRNFIIIYRVDESKKEVIIVTVSHFKEKY